MDMTTCPECGEPAEVQWRDVLESTDGPVEHAKVVCVRRHWFFLPVASLAAPTAGGQAWRTSPGDRTRETARTAEQKRQRTTAPAGWATASSAQGRRQEWH